MKNRLMVLGAVGLTMFSLTADACKLTVTVLCPNDNTAAGIEVFIKGVTSATTDDQGVAVIDLPYPGHHTLCVNKTTLPKGATIATACQYVYVGEDDTSTAYFELGGDFCGTPPPPGGCWLTGGGTTGKTKGDPNYSFGGVVYPGCSPKAAEGGNWNVVDHFAGLHFQGQQIIVDGCSGVATKSPKVTMNIIDFHGVGIVSGVSGNDFPQTLVTFVGRCIDVLEPAGGKDMIYLKAVDGANTLLQIGTTVDNPATITTGNLQIHMSGCSKYVTENPLLQTQ